MKYKILAIFDWFITTFWKEKVEKYIDWKLYEIGFTGQGPTAFDEKPEFSKPKLPNFIKNRLDSEGEKWCKVCQSSFKNACLNVLGEDPDDWDSWYR